MEPCLDFISENLKGVQDMFSFGCRYRCHNCTESEADAHGGCYISAESDFHGDAPSAPTPTPTAKFFVDPRDDNED